jgi:histidinol-phosphate aminotransferase
MIHGGLDARGRLALGDRAATLLDLSVNLNPYGAAPRVLEAIKNADISSYPDPTAYPVRAAYGRRWGVAADAVVLGHGAAELLWTTVRALLRPGDPVVTVEPTFSEVGAAARSHGCRLSPLEAARDTFALDLQALSRHVAQASARLVYLCTPNNPTGVPLRFSEIAALAQAHPRVWFVVDQAFLSLSDRHADLAQVPLGNVICVRSLTKDHALAGLRLGYLLAEPRTARRIEAARPPWSTSAPAQAAALACLDEEAFVANSRGRMRADRQRMAQVLEACGLAPLASDAPYLLFQAPNAAALHHGLLHAHGILVRDCGSFGLPGHLRVCGLREVHAARVRQAFERAMEAIS